MHHIFLIAAEYEEYAVFSSVTSFLLLLVNYVILRYMTGWGAMREYVHKTVFMNSSWSCAAANPKKENTFTARYVRCAMI